MFFVFLYMVFKQIHQLRGLPTFIYIYFQYITLYLSMYASCFINAATTITFAFKDNNKSHKTTAKTTATYTESIFIYIKLKIYFWQIHVTNMRNGISMI